MLLLHGLHPIAVEKRARRAVDRIRPEILARGCHLGPVEITSGVLRVCLYGKDAPAVATMLRNGIFDAAPDLKDVLIELTGADDVAAQRMSA